MLKKILAVASTVVLFTTGAHAVTFDLTGPGGGDLSGTGVRTATFNKDGVSGYVRSGSTYYGGRYSVITPHDTGIGVDNGRHGDSSEVDGRRGDDWLTFSFGTAVKLVSVTFGNFTAYTDGWFGWKFDDDDAWVNVHGDGAFGRFTDQSTYFFNNAVGRSFSVAAWGRNDDFVVTSFTVAPIPLPASALLLIGGLAGFGVMRRRKRLA